MSVRLSIAVWVLTAAVGCGGGDPPPPANTNPYANNDTVGPSAPAPAPVVPRATPPGRRSSPASADPPAPKVDVPEPDYAAELAVPLSFVEYARFARRSSEMLAEMTRIHAAVSEAGHADEHQQRWGELTAEHSALVRDVMGSAYPPADLAAELQQNALPRLEKELQQAAAVMEEFVDVEGGLSQPYAEAKRIYEHLAKNLDRDAGRGGAVVN